VVPPWFTAASQPQPWKVEATAPQPTARYRGPPGNPYFVLCQTWIDYVPGPILEHFRAAAREWISALHPAASHRPAARWKWCRPPTCLRHRHL